MSRCLAYRFVAASLWPAPFCTIRDNTVMKLSSRQARKLAGMRQTYAGGRPRIPRPCPRCGAECGSARQAQAHCAAPELGDFYIELAYLSRQIHQRRKANNEKLDTGRCYPEKIDPLRQFQLLDWIEAELKRILGRDESEPVE